MNISREQIFLLRLRSETAGDFDLRAKTLYGAKRPGINSERKLVLRNSWEVQHFNSIGIWRYFSPWEEFSAQICWGFLKFTCNSSNNMDSWSLEDVWRLSWKAGKTTGKMLKLVLGLKKHDSINEFKKFDSMLLVRELHIPELLNLLLWTWRRKHP